METPPNDPQEPRRRTGPPMVLLGAVGALVAGGAIAWVLVAGDRPSAPAPAAAAGPGPAATPVSACLRYSGGRWRRVSADAGLDACVQSLFAGRCEKPGGASYGRYGGQTLRLVTGRVEVSDDNRTFRQLAP